MTIDHLDRNSLRTQIRLAVLSCFAIGSHGSVKEVKARIEATATTKEQKAALKAGANTLTIQLAQVRNELFKEVGVPVPEVNGRLTNDQKAAIAKKLGTDRVKGKVKDALKNCGLKITEVRQGMKELAQAA